MKRQMHSQKRLPRQAYTRHKEPREPRKAIISFRLRRSEVSALKDDMEQHVGPQISSLKQFCRKLATDYTKNLLVYADPLDRQIPPGANVKSEPTCDIKDADFLKELHRFLDGKEENWRKLRAFMLGLGWPERQAKAFRATLKDYERLQLARKVLSKMIKSLQ